MTKNFLAALSGDIRRVGPTAVLDHVLRHSQPGAAEGSIPSSEHGARDA